ncbi:uncharacterized protein [Panulirus ornatus]|uniref:uncharacterized protein isoform X12 n=1 Tax=Panulirus ornatus TaxID=150431 RepID=UPI003A83A356
MPHRNSLALCHPQSGIKVNGHSLDSITREFLLDGVDQNVQESWRANYMGMDVFTTRGSPIAGTISGVLTSVSVGGMTVCDLVVMTRDDIVADNLVYTAPISIFGDVLVSGLVDGQDVDHLFSTRVTLDGIQTLSASYIFEAIRVEGEWPLARQHNPGVPTRWCGSECTGKLACKLHGSGCLHHPWQSHSRNDLWSAN